MAYDEELAERIREVLDAQPDLAGQVTEKKMFGGLAFLVAGNMAVSASGRGGIMVRVDPDRSAALVKAGPAYPMVMQGRSMAGWLRVDAEHVRTKPQLAKWVKLGTGYAKTLPPKAGTSGKGRSRRT